jgi:methylamine dehydrogenase accessory protein MauD
MDGILLSARLIVAAVLLVAGVAKLADRDGARTATRAFGAPAPLAARISALLIGAELAAGVLLIPSATAEIGAVAAASLLLTFCAAIARSVIRGEAPDCHCFGQLHSAPAGPRALARNLLLAAIAVLVIVAGPGASATAWLAHVSGTGWLALSFGSALALTVTAVGAFGLSMLRRHGQLLLRIDALEDALGAHGIALPQPELPPAGLPVGAPAPVFELSDLRHRRVALRDLIARERPAMLVFTDPGCGPCTALLPQIGVWQREHAESLTIALISRGERDTNLAHAREHELADVLLQSDREIAERYQVSGTPSAVLIAADGSIASSVQAGADAITGLLTGEVGAPVLPIHRHAPFVPRPAPDVALHTLDGTEVMLSTQLDGPTAVVFWNPACGFCERMLPDLRAAERTVPNLLLISTGNPEVNRQLGLSAPILLDGAFAAGSAFEAAGTPSAVLVEDGMTGSPVAVGAEAVLALLSRATDARQAA